MTTFSPGDRVRPTDQPEVRGTVVSVPAAQSGDASVHPNAPAGMVRVQWDGGSASFLDPGKLELAPE